MDYLLLCLWALCLSLAWIGTGRQVLRLLGFAEMSWPLGGLVGSSAFVFVGGFLNLAGMVHRPSLIVMVVLGNILFLTGLASPRVRLSEAWTSFSEQPWYVRGMAMVCMAMLITFALESLTFTRLNRWDDLPSYLTYPVKLIQLGSLPFDPFSERRMTSGLGATFFLQSFMLVVGDVRSMLFIDQGVGLVLFAGCIYASGRKLGNSVAICLGLALLVLFLPLSHMNLTMTTLPAAFFVAFFLIEAADETPTISRSVLLGLLAASVTLLKSTYLPVALLIVFGLHLLRLRERIWTRTVRDALIAALVFIVVMLPWMLDMKRKQGTLLYPLLGKGFEIAAYGPVPHFFNPGLYPIEIGLTVLVVCVVAAAAHWIAARGLPHIDKISMMILASGLVVLPISIAVAGASLSRYTKPFLLPFALILLASMTRIRVMGKSTRSRSLVLALCATSVIVGLLVYGKGDRGYIFFRYLLRQQHTTIAGDEYFYVLTDDVWAQERKRESRLQNVIPPGQAVFASYLPTFAMNFQRNPIYVADFPGMSSLPPGMPTQGTPAALRSYLLSKSVRYIAYSPKLTAEEDEVVNWLPPKPGKTWPIMEGLNAADVDRQMISLAETCRLIYDDGEYRVIDLLQPH